MNEITTVGLDLAKNVFRMHAVDAEGTTVLRKQFRRAQLLAFFSRLPRRWRAFVAADPGQCSLVGDPIRPRRARRAGGHAIAFSALRSSQHRYTLVRSSYASQ